MLSYGLSFLYGISVFYTEFFWFKFIFHQNPLFMRKHKSFPFWIVLFTLLFYVSCRKSNHDISVVEKPTSIERFFNLPESADPRLKAIAQNIKAQENKQPFLEKIIKKAGWP